jgi:4'-phosphopantetheinyl transferase
MKIYVFNIKQIDNNIFKKLYKFTSIEKQSQILKYSFFEDAIRTMIGELLIRLYVVGKYRINNNSIKFSKGTFGKPYLKNVKDMEFNISHSGDWVVVAFGRSELGIDIEFMKQIDFGIASRFFSRYEKDFIISGNQDMQRHRFYQIWTLKESYLKAIGTGLSGGIKEISFCKPDGMFFLDGVHPKYNFSILDFVPEYKLALCSTTNCVPEILRIDLSEILYAFEAQCIKGSEM